jgi:small subunit ribosomal protein S4
VEDVISVRGKSQKNASIQESLESADRKGIPNWLSVDRGKVAGRIVAFPSRDQITIPIQEELIVEYYSR